MLHPLQDILYLIKQVSSGNCLWEIISLLMKAGGERERRWSEERGERESGWSEERGGVRGRVREREREGEGESGARERGWRGRGE